MNCPLCSTPSTTIYFTDTFRSYFHCTCCDLVYADSSSYLIPSEEKSRYDLHNNDPMDPRYRKFLSRVFDPVKALITPGASGLDFGAGPGPTLSLMFEESGHDMKIFDLYYANHPEVLKPNSFDFVTCTEVIEHVQDAKNLIPMLFGLLKPGGPLALMTKLCTGLEQFKNWHYKKDPTHICFYSIETFNYIAEKFNCELKFHGDDVIILTPRP